MCFLRVFEDRKNQKKRSIYYLELYQVYVTPKETAEFSLNIPVCT